MKKLSILLTSILLTFLIAGCFAQGEQSTAQSALASGNLELAATNIQAALAREPDNPELKKLGAEIFTRRGGRLSSRGQLSAELRDGVGLHGDDRLAAA